MPTLEELTAQLEDDGLPRSTALEIARDLTRRVERVQPPLEQETTRLALIAELWQQARAEGAKTLTVRLEVSGDGVTTRIRVLERADRTDGA